MINTLGVSLLVYAYRESKSLYIATMKSQGTDIMLSSWQCTKRSWIGLAIVSCFVWHMHKWLYRHIVVCIVNKVMVVGAALWQVPCVSVCLCQCSLYMALHYVNAENVSDAITTLPTECQLHSTHASDKDNIPPLIAQLMRKIRQWRCFTFYPVLKLLIKHVDSIPRRLSKMHTYSAIQCKPECTEESQTRALY